MALSPYYRFWTTIPFISKLGQKMYKGNPDIEIVLERANKNLRGEVFYSGCLWNIVDFFHYWDIPGHVPQSDDP